MRGQGAADQAEYGSRSRAVLVENVEHLRGVTLLPAARIAADQDACLGPPARLVKISADGSANRPRSSNLPCTEYLMAEAVQSRCKLALASTSSASLAGVSRSDRSMSVLAGWRAAAATISSTPVMPNSRAARSQSLSG